MFQQSPTVCTFNFQVRPHGIGVSISFPPDTDTPGFEEENKNKV